MTCLSATKRLGAAATASEPQSLSSLAQDQKMNRQRDTIDRSIAAIEALADKATTVYRLMNLLVNNLEESFDSRRAQRADEHTSICSFSNDGVDTTLWLMGEIHHASTGLREAVFLEQGRLNDLRDGVSA
jgi:hypothetical protein